MKQEDGTEVYLKPRGDGSDNLRFPELMVPDHDPMRRRCCIPVIESDCQVVVRFSNDFDLFTANSARIGYQYNEPRFGGSNASLGIALRRSMVVGQQKSIPHLFQTKNEKKPIRLVPYTSEQPWKKIQSFIDMSIDPVILRSKQPENSAHIKSQPSFGTLMVHIGRGNFEWM